MFIKNKKNNKGFTLVELLVVIAIIGILAVVAVPSLMQNMEKAKSAKIVSDFSAIKSALMAEYADGNLTNSTDLQSLVEDISNEADYQLNIVGDPITSVSLIITPNNPNVLSRLQEDIGGTLYEGDSENPATLTVDIVK